MAQALMPALFGRLFMSEPMGPATRRSSGATPLPHKNP